ncbi:O-linked N-acetylglucosamine transferase, SPINDLY family protein [Cyanobacterium sp. Dongsha4]|uniref:O-linked N-acetylglucosamine transferase, SPINDLY family protein n=1 Tax=Cyanobacterium sp. DS4 TaxID=2878255 RepID=UPI002E81EFE6|nr:O-linked N-acetylglucosamine transferase, SPINDLY family protein [Cyanobacterium sp. Dongsha4]WVL02245.1 O-linked N-acetylglucosamine transferase, SPINDLY family protein [Cyanobacterium sp. Dongsha4]
MTNWNPQVKDYLQQKDFGQVVTFYESLVENYPEEVSNYWYLGLAYLLAQKEQECQSTWLTVFFEADELNQDKCQQELVNILEKEANYLADNKELYLSYSIREKIKEIEPNNLNNLLDLALLKFNLNILKIDDIKDINLNNLLDENSVEIDDEKLLNFMDNILLIPCDECLDFADIANNYFQGNKEITDLFLSKAEVMGQERKYYFYASQLVEICIKNQPNNLEIIKQGIYYYSSNYNYEKSKILAQRFYDYSNTLAEKSLALRQLISNAITVGDWQKAFNIIPEYRSILMDLVEEQPHIEKAYIRTCLSMLTQPLLYFDDQARGKRLIINGVGALFQKLTQDHYSCPVHFPSPNTNNLSRKLKIGYIGHTMRSHSVGLLSRWLMRHHDKEKFTTYAYFICHQVEDDITKQYFRDVVDYAYNSNNVINDLVTQIEKDEIDILVDLDSFTHNMTSMIMALKPAPIQVSWLGMDTNGIPAIDYFIADPYVLPDNAQEYYQEKIWRLPHSYVAVDGFEVDTTPLKREDLDIPESAIIYFNTQNALKRYPATIHSQMKIIKAVPNSYLVIKGDGNQEILKQLFTTIAEQEGVDRTRLRFLERSPSEEIHRANLQIADVVLDTYPYNGATTTLETLWMEIPLVTRVGEQFAARNSYTFMMNAGITEGIAWSDEEYIEWGIKLGTDENLRKEVSWKLRQSKKTSPLWNGKQFTKEMEKAYQQMWEIYVNQHTKIESS